MLPGNYTQGIPWDHASAPHPPHPQTAQCLALPLRGRSQFCFPKCTHQAWRQTLLDLLFQFTLRNGKIMALYIRSMQLSQAKKPSFLRNNYRFLARGRMRSASTVLKHLLNDLHPTLHLVFQNGGETGEIGDGLGEVSKRYYFQKNTPILTTSLQTDFAKAASLGIYRPRGNQTYNYTQDYARRTEEVICCGTTFCTQ